MDAHSDSFADGNETFTAPLAHVKRLRRRPGENRDRLIDAGITLFASAGYHGASTSAIAALADVPQPHVYASFQTKHDLFLTCVRRVVIQLESATDHSALNECIRSDTRITYSAFLIQCFAAYQVQQLQPDLGQLMQELQEAIGFENLVALMNENIRDVLH